ncbi:MAG: invasion associated locus B family protein [Methylovirgula sp.]
MWLFSRFMVSSSSRLAFLAALAGLAAGAALADPAGQAVRRDETVYDLWTVNCAYFAAPAKKKCAASLPVRRSGTQQLVVVLAIGPDGKGEVRFQVTVPTSTMVQPGVIAKFEPGGELRLPILSCDRNACLASVPYSRAIATHIAGASKVDVGWTNIASGPVETGFSVKGAREALAALSR